MSTARTTPAQKPRGRTLSKIFPVSVCIIILISSFRRLYHTSLILMGARVCQQRGSNGSYNLQNPLRLLKKLGANCSISNVRYLPYKEGGMFLVLLECYLPA